MGLLKNYLELKFSVVNFTCNAFTSSLGFLRRKLSDFKEAIAGALIDYSSVFALLFVVLFPLPLLGLLLVFGSVFYGLALVAKNFVAMMIESWLGFGRDEEYSLKTQGAGKGRKDEDEGVFYVRHSYRDGEDINDDDEEEEEDYSDYSSSFYDDTESEDDESSDASSSEEEEEDGDDVEEEGEDDDDGEEAAAMGKEEESQGSDVDDDEKGREAHSQDEDEEEDGGSSDDEGDYGNNKDDEDSDNDESNNDEDTEDKGTDFQQCGGVDGSLTAASSLRS